MPAKRTRAVSLTEKRPSQKNLSLRYDLCFMLPGYVFRSQNTKLWAAGLDLLWTTRTIRRYCIQTDGNRSTHYAITMSKMAPLFCSLLSNQASLLPMSRWTRGRAKLVTMTMLFAMFTVSGLGGICWNLEALYQSTALCYQNHDRVIIDLSQLVLCLWNCLSSYAQNTCVGLRISKYHHETVLWFFCSSLPLAPMVNSFDSPWFSTPYEMYINFFIKFYLYILKK